MSDPEMNAAYRRDYAEKAKCEEVVREVDALLAVGLPPRTAQLLTAARDEAQRMAAHIVAVWD